MKNSKKRVIKQMEKQDALGISRRTSKRTMSPKTYFFVRSCLIIAIPAVYFLCSPFLIVVMALWILLLRATVNIEKNYNSGLKKDLCTKLPKTDSVLCIVLVLLVLISAVVSSVSMTSKGSMFEGMNSSQIEGALKEDFDAVKFTLMRIFSKIKEFGSLTTGTRWLFLSERVFIGGVGGGMQGGSPPPDMGAPGGGDISDMLSNMPFSMLFQSIIKAVCTALLAVICIVGIISSVKIKKLNLSEGELTEKEMIRAMKREEERRRKEREKNNYYSMKKTDYSQLEREVLSDLAFLFEDIESEEDKAEE